MAVTVANLSGQFARMNIESMNIQSIKVKKGECINSSHSKLLCQTNNNVLMYSIRYKSF